MISIPMLIYADIYINMNEVGWWRDGRMKMGALLLDRLILQLKNYADDLGISNQQQRNEIKKTVFVFIQI